jgi:hypothetical protein
MIKKIAIIFALAFLALGVSAQLPVGGWTIHTPFGGVSSIVETKGMTYYLSVGSLFSYNKSTQEVRSLNISTGLNSGTVSNIYAEPNGNYLLVVYTDNNIDRLNDDGSIINISDISDAFLTGSPTINHVGFGKNRFYVATSFGLVTFDAKKNEAIETMFSPKEVQKVFGLGDNVVIVYESVLRTAKQSDHLTSIDKFNLIGGDTSTWTYGDQSTTIGNNRIMFQHKSGNNTKVIVATIDFDTPKVTFDQSMSTAVATTKVVPMGPDKAFSTDETTIFTYEASGSPTKSQYPSKLKGYALSALNGMEEVWAGNSAGIGRYNLSQDTSNPIQEIATFGTVDYATPECNRILPQASGDLLLMHATGYINSIALGLTGRYNLALTTYNKETGFKGITPNVTIDEPTWVVEDPHNPNILYISKFWFNNGVYRFENGEQTFAFNENNSPITRQYLYGVIFMGFDAFDNFWVIQESAYTFDNDIHVIPYSELIKETPSKDAWTTFTGQAYRTTVATFLKQSSMLVFARGEWSTSISFLKQKGTATFDDDEIVEAKTYIDQDNKTLSFNHVCALAEDAKGRLWVGTNKGIFEITDPTKVTSDVVSVKHLKVPRNDGTGLADYLLDALTASAIAVDSSNRKWISTTTDGVYLVSEDGDEILEHYTSSNSILPSDCVYSVACDPNSASVFFATASGLVEYNATSAPASDDLDNVYAYPNPVRPSYSGWITIAGLMDNTLVTITDAAGNLVHKGTSEGGILTWDGCDLSGERVKTGVYFVFASNGTSTSSSNASCVTKIMVIN